MPDDQPRESVLHEPWRRTGVRPLWRDRRLVSLFSRRQRATRLQGTLLGGLWDFINPLVQFMVYFLVIGVLLGLNRRVENFPLYIYSGLLTAQFFIGGLSTANGALTRNRLLMRKAVFPTEALIAAQLVTQAIAMVPPLVVLLAASLLLGWSPDPRGLALGAAGMLLLAVFTYGMGLVFGVANVFIRDSAQVVGVITTLARWATPIIYPWDLVRETYGDGVITTLYLANPVTIGVFGMREAFWQPTVEQVLAPMSATSVVIGTCLSISLVVVGYALLFRYQDRIIQRLRWTT